jgi:hypothetical protein
VQLSARHVPARRSHRRLRFEQKRLGWNSKNQSSGTLRLRRGTVPACYLQWWSYVARIRRTRWAEFRSGWTSPHTVSVTRISEGFPSQAGQVTQIGNGPVKRLTTTVYTAGMRRKPAPGMDLRQIEVCPRRFGSEKCNALGGAPAPKLGTNPHSG